MISGDAGADGTIPIKQLDGQIRDTPFYTSATATITGGIPNAEVTIKLSGAGARLVRLPAGSTVTLDSQGNATFAILSKGDFILGKAPEDLLIAVSKGAITVQTPVKIVSRKWYALLRDFASYFDWGDPHGTTATAEDFATGMLSSGNTQDVAMQTHWATGQRETYTKMGYAATGIAMEFFAGGTF